MRRIIFRLLLLSIYISVFVCDIETIEPIKVSALTPHPPISINGNSGFTPENGVVGGSGTSSDPFVIEGWEIPASGGAGINIQDTTAYFIIRNVYVYGASQTGGIHLVNVLNGQIRDSNISNCGRGIYFQGTWGPGQKQTRYVSVINCTISDAPGASGYGIYFFGASNNSIVDCEITNNGAGGIEFDASFAGPVTGNTVIGCTLIHNGYGANLLPAYSSISAYSGGNYVYHNNFIDNAARPQDISGGNFWDDGYPSGGNYWDDYSGNDTYSGPYQNETGRDGIGDTPYVLRRGNNMDRYPLINPWVPEDTSAPEVTILSPLNMTYTTSSVPLTLNINEPTSWIGYSLDGQANVTITGNTSLAGLSEGSHYITVYANDTSGNMGVSDKVYFTIEISRSDLSVSSPDITFANFNPSEGETITISGTVHNIGEENVENVSVKFFDGATMIGERLISFISYHSQGTVSIDWTAENEGFHLIKVVADPYNAINETNEENNEATRSILVGEIPHFGGIVVNGSATPNETLTGSPVIVQGYAWYNTTYGAGEPVAGAEVTITIIGWQQETARTINDGTYTADITAPYAPGNYTIFVTVTDYTFWESIEIRLVVTQETGVDLTLSHHDISFSLSDPIENQNVSITATIHNIGTENATNVLVAFYDDGKPIGNRTIDLISAGGSEDITIPWNATPWEWHTITVVIDPEDTIPGELNENNNEASKPIYVYPPLPDLTPTNIDFSDSTPVVNQLITISANIKNIGGIGAGDVLVSFYDGGQSIGNVTIPWIPGKGEFRTASINHTFVTDGERTICVIADPDNSTNEADEENNQQCRSIYVHLPLPDLTLSSSDITFSNSTPTIGDIITIYATIHNIGEVDAQNITVEFFDGDIRLNYTTVPSINASKQETVDVSWNATPVGWHRIKVVIDGNNTILESDEINNIASRYIYVYPLSGEAADLCIYSEDIVFSNTNPSPGENVTIYATVHNIGEAEAENVTATFYVNDTQLGFPHAIASIPVSQNETVSTKWIALQVGSYVVKVVVDTPIESNKKNNNATRGTVVGKPDVAIVNATISKTVVGQGYCINVTVTAENQGDFTVNFNITAYADLNTTIIGDEIAIGIQNVTLSSGNSTTVTFTWNTTGVAKGNYTVSAYAWPVSGETDLADNTFIDGVVLVTKKGDVNGDDNVNVLDLIVVANALGTSPGDTNWNPNADVKDDQTINVLDLTVVANYLGT